MMMKKLPLGISTFSEIIEDGYVYIDKTRSIYEMTETGKIYFLSSPRRFGKSLLVSTLEELFKGNKKLFKDLYIYDKWNWNENFPVIHLDFGNIDYENPERLELSLEDFVMDIADEYNITLKSRFLNPKFSELIKKLHEKIGKKVVVLIDEYDKPIIDKISDIQMAEANREVLSNFYQVLKGSDKYLRFIFLTGVSKFSKTTIFSKLNNLKDITLNPKYTTICGYSHKDIEKYFSEYISTFSQENNIDNKTTLKFIKKWYDGYSWDGENFLYNPFSIISFLDSGEFNNYWFDTGTPKFLIDIIKEDKDNSDMDLFLNPVTTFAGSFPDFNLEQLDLTTILLQTGYLTIKEKKAELDELPVYKLAIPNKEVDESFYGYLLGAYTNETAGTVQPLAKKDVKLYTKS
jgi:hypothetical protein